MNRRNLSQHHCELIQAAWRLSSRRSPEYYPGHPSTEALALNERAKIMYNTDLLTRIDTQTPNIPPDRVPNFSYCLSAKEVITGIYRSGDVYITNEKDIPFITSAFSDTIIQKRKLLKYIVTRTQKYSSHTEWSAHGCKLLMPIFNSFKKTSSVPKLLKYTKQVYDTIPCNYKMHQLKGEHPDPCSTCTAKEIETPEHVLYCSSSSRKSVRTHILSSIDAWIDNTRMTAHTQAHLRQLSQILKAQRYDINRRGIWTGRPHNEILTRSQNYVKLTLQNQGNNISLNRKVIVAFHIKLIKASQLLWRLRCFEVNTTSSQQQKLNELTNANEILDYMRESQEINGKG
jgi:hypothetical protein